jgi:hypothetical protein
MACRWAFAAHLEHERPNSELRGLLLEDAKKAIGHSGRAKRSNPVQGVSISSVRKEAVVDRSSESIAGLAAALAKAQAALVDPEKSPLSTQRSRRCYHSFVWS